MQHSIRLDGTSRVRLSDIHPEGNGGWTREAAEARTAELGTEFSALADLLTFAGSHSLLLVLQGRDTSGKDGCIRKVLEFSNAQSVRVEPFKVPSELERRHDFLWRVHARVPPAGAIALFNRSHYEDVLVPLVHKSLPANVIRRRYDRINEFEQLLTDAGTVIVKVYLHISSDEQVQRLLEREKEPEKAWKLSVGDWREREFWDDYTGAYEALLHRCSRPHAPWHIVPANRKWYRNLCVMEAVVQALTPY